MYVCVCVYVFVCVCVCVYVCVCVCVCVQHYSAIQQTIGISHLSENLADFWRSNEVSLHSKHVTLHVVTLRGGGIHTADLNDTPLHNGRQCCDTADNYCIIMRHLSETLAVSVVSLIRNYFNINSQMQDAANIPSCSRQQLQVLLPVGNYVIKLRKLIN